MTKQDLRAAAERFTKCEYAILDRRYANDLQALAHYAASLLDQSPIDEECESSDLFNLLLTAARKVEMNDDGSYTVRLPEIRLRNCGDVRRVAEVLLDELKGETK